ncbi:hypothetical protein N0V84_008384 [Fusarium piperis]|uniref:Uncharacterized protein n=1 Tax=Fusarium piperis TaxID=1435070 RepID=A0A9W8W873_9HYPO|nr:hypothetical protein N0V84_008384 [Fusarium piperis]
MRPRYVVKKANNATEQDAEDEDDLKDASERGPSQTGIRSRHNEQRERSSSGDYPGEERSISSQETAATPRRELEEEQSSHSHVSGAVQAVDTDCGDAEKGRSFAVSAIYVSNHSLVVTLFHSLMPDKMPYLYFSTYHHSESDDKRTKDPLDDEKKVQEEKKVKNEINMRKELFTAYEDSVIHQPTTLDEFYYQFASDEDSVRDRNSRNKDQVATKYQLPGGTEKERFWPLLRVSQLWIWTIDEKWLITSTSCATNDIRDNLVTDILEHLRRQVQNGSRRFGPTSATEMSRVIVDYCIGTYDRKRKRQPKERSIHQIFSDSINKIGREESSLFSLSYDRRHYAKELTTPLDTVRTSEIMEDLRTALTKVSEQLCHIKDIRDELNILMSIARFQRKVQSTMARSGPKSPDEDLSSDYLLRDIKELDKFAEQTQEAVR